EEFADAVVDLRRRGAVVAERLLQHDARSRCDQRLLRESFGNRREQIRAGRKEERPHPLRLWTQQLREPHEVAVGLCVDAHVLEVLGEQLPFLLIEGAAEVRFATGSYLLQPFLAAELAAGGADDAGRADDLAGAAAPIQGRQELAHGEVASTAEQDEIERGK